MFTFSGTVSSVLGDDPRPPFRDPSGAVFLPSCCLPCFVNYCKPLQLFITNSNNIPSKKSLSSSIPSPQNIYSADNPSLVCISARLRPDRQCSDKDFDLGLLLLSGNVAFLLIKAGIGSRTAPLSPSSAAARSRAGRLTTAEASGCE